MKKSLLLLIVFVLSLNTCLFAQKMETESLMKAIEKEILTVAFPEVLEKELVLDGSEAMLNFKVGALKKKQIIEVEGVVARAQKEFSKYCNDFQVFVKDGRFNVSLKLNKQKNTSIKVGFYIREEKKQATIFMRIIATEWHHDNKEGTSSQRYGVYEFAGVK